MELRQVIGNRRSIRFLLPHKPVELEKVQCMLEAARIASHWGNINSLRALVIERDKAPQDVIDALPSPVGGYQTQLAPVVIVWYVETDASDDAGPRVRELVQVGAVGYGDKKMEQVENTLVPMFANLGDALKGPGMNEIDCGQGIAQATLMAFELGLGTCCHGLGQLRRRPHQARSARELPRARDPDRGLPGRRPESRRPAAAPALRAALPAERLRQPLPALEGRSSSSSRRTA